MGEKTRREESRHQSEELFHLRIKILVLSVCELFLGALITRVGYPCRLDDFAKYAWIKWRLFFFKIFEFIAWKSGSLFRVLQNTLTIYDDRLWWKKKHTHWGNLHHRRSNSKVLWCFQSALGPGGKYDPSTLILREGLAYIGWASSWWCCC